MKAIAVYPGKAHSMHLEEISQPKVTDIPTGRGVLVKVLRVGVDGTDKEINEAFYGQAPTGPYLKGAWRFPASGPLRLPFPLAHGLVPSFQRVQYLWRFIRWTACSILCHPFSDKTQKVNSGEYDGESGDRRNT